MGDAIPRKRRNHPAIRRGSKLFSKFMHAGDVEMAAKVAFATVLELHGTAIFVAALDAANSCMRRRRYRRGL
jgi:hypothetical protein